MLGIDIAKSKLGLHEKRNRKEVMECFKSVLLKGEYLLDPVTTPWCARFIGFCERKAGKPGTGKDNARSYLTYGTKVKLPEAREGDIVVFTRGTSNWQGHVAYFVKDNKDGTIKVLGGNQIDSVCYRNYDTDDILGIRRS